MYQPQFDDVNNIFIKLFIDLYAEEQVNKVFTLIYVVQIRLLLEKLFSS